MIEPLVRTFLHKIVDADTSVTEQYMPAVEDELWKQVFAYAPEQLKGKVAQRWLTTLNNSIINRSFLEENRVRTLVTYMEQHFGFMAELHPYLDDTAHKEEYFDGTVSALLKHLGSYLPGNAGLPMTIMLEHLWFGDERQKKNALLDLCPFLLSLDSPDDMTPAYGCLLAHLGWKAVDELELSDEHVVAAIHLSQDCGLSDIVPVGHTNKRHELWHALTHFSRQPRFFRNAHSFDYFNPSDWHGQNIKAELANMEVTQALIPFKNLLIWHANASVLAPILQPMKTPTLFQHLHPEDTTIFDVLKRWLPQASGAWDCTAAVGGSLQEAIELAALGGQTVVKTSSPLPDDLSTFQA